MSTTAAAPSGIRLGLLDSPVAVQTRGEIAPTSAGQVKNTASKDNGSEITTAQEITSHPGINPASCPE